MFPLNYLFQYPDYFGPIVSIFQQKRGILVVDMDLVVTESEEQSSSKNPLPEDHKFWLRLYRKSQLAAANKGAAETGDFSDVDAAVIENWKTEKKITEQVKLAVVREWLHKCTFVKVGTASYRSVSGKKATLAGQSLVIINDFLVNTTEEYKYPLRIGCASQIDRKEIYRKPENDLESHQPINLKRRSSSILYSRMPVEKFQNFKLSLFDGQITVKIPILFSRNIKYYLKEDSSYSLESYVIDNNFEYINAIGESDDDGEDDFVVKQQPVAVPIGTVSLFHLRSLSNRDVLLDSVKEFLETWKTDPLDQDCAVYQERYQSFWRNRWIPELSLTCSNQKSQQEITDMMERYIISRINIPIDPADYDAQQKFNESSRLKIEDVEREVTSSIIKNVSLAKNIALKCSKGKIAWP